MRKNREMKDRLQRVLLQDRMAGKCNMLPMLKSDLEGLLADYFDLDKESLRLEVSADEDGSYRIVMRARAVRMYR
ncbi:MAG: cell division topological specificity factor MinE [Clostridia bacterium]|nr:cell division topological specificity factor MinE [Clostridia bacterium]